MVMPSRFSAQFRRHYGKLVPLRQKKQSLCRKLQPEIMTICFVP